MLGSNPSGSFNLNPDCNLHGYESEWYNSPEQIQHQLEVRARSIDLQIEAIQARRKAREESSNNLDTGTR